MGLFAIGQNPELGYGAELASHFLLQYCLAALLVTLTLLLLGRWLSAVIGTAFLGILACWLVPFYLPPSLPAVATGTAEKNSGITLRLLQYNTYYESTDIRDTAEWLIRHQQEFDIVNLQEVNPRLRKILEEKLTEFPHRPKHLRQRYLASRYPIRNVEILPFPSPPAYYLTLEMVLPDGRPVRIYSIHTASPVSKIRVRWRNQQLAQLAEITRIQQQKTPVIVVGDHNITPYSPIFRAYEQESGMINTMRGYGIQNSWPSFSRVAMPRDYFLLDWLRIPIDHIMVSPDFRILSREILPPLGSDHLPVRVVLELPAATESATR